MQSVDTVDGLLGTELDDKLSGTLAIGKIGAFVSTIGTSEIGDCRDVSDCDAELCDGLSGSNGS